MFCRLCCICQVYALSAVCCVLCAVLCAVFFDPEDTFCRSASVWAMGNVLCCLLLCVYSNLYCAGDLLTCAVLCVLFAVSCDVVHAKRSDSVLTVLAGTSCVL